MGQIHLIKFDCPHCGIILEACGVASLSGPCSHCGAYLEVSCYVQRYSAPPEKITERLPMLPTSIVVKKQSSLADITMPKRSHLPAKRKQQIQVEAKQENQDKKKKLQQLSGKPQYFPMLEKERESDWEEL